MEPIGYHLERSKTLIEYITQKISMLEDEFYLKLNYEDIAHMCSLKTEADVDRFAHQILVDRL